MPKDTALQTLDYIVKTFKVSPSQTSPIAIPDTDRETLASLFKELGFKRGVEIGVEEGIYAEVLCKANPDALLCCVDSWKAYKGFSEHTTQSKLDELYEKTQDRLKPYNVKFIRKFSQDAVKDFDDNSLDFVYIDGNHKYQYVMDDLTEWTKKVRPGGIISGHDYRRDKSSLIQVVEALGDYTTANNITFFILGRKELMPGEKRDKHRSWMFVKSQTKNENMLGKWDKWYKKITTMGAFRYGDTVTYKLAADFLKDMKEVEDWGCGTGGFKRFYNGKYTGLDGSANPFVDKVVDLLHYRSNVDGIVMRHVLEHNYDWKKILTGATESFNKKFCLILFTPFQDETREIAHNKQHGVDVPDIAFARKDIEDFLVPFKWRMESHKTKTGYGVEHIYYIEKNNLSGPKIAVISANLGNLDKINPNVPQTLQHDFFLYTDGNFPPRSAAMTPRLQAKIPKCFAWQMVPDYDYYLWLDGTLSLSEPDSLQFFYDNCKDHDIVVFRHRSHPNVRQEARYTRKGIKQEAPYIVTRYKNELLPEIMQEIEADKNFVDDLMVNGGVFMYRNTPEVQQMLKDWWYYMSRYIIQDQISFPYVLKKSGVRLNVRPESFGECKYLLSKGHRADSK